MANRANVPKFGNWEKEQVQYTVFFENARAKKGAGGPVINPNDPQENPGAFNYQANLHEEERRERVRLQYEKEQRQKREQVEAQGNRPIPASASTRNNQMRPRFTQQVEPQQHQHHGAVSVPKFGDWNGGNAESGGGYTMIFEKMKENKQNGVVNPPVPAYTPPPRYQQERKENPRRSKKSTGQCCIL